MASSVKYSRLATDDECRVDFSSPFTYETETTAKNSFRKYGSVYQYGKSLGDSGIQITRGSGSMSALKKLAHSITIICCILILIFTFPVSLIFVLKQIKSYEKAVISRLGCIVGCKGPGTIAIIPCLDKITKVDTREKAFNVPPQKAMTIDGALVEFGAVVRYQIVDAEKSVLACQDLNHALRVTAQTASIKYIGTLKEKEVADSRTVNRDMKFDLQKQFVVWGVKIRSYAISPTKLIVRMEQPDAVATVIEPLKQWLFGNDDNSDMAKIANAMSSGLAGKSTGAAEVIQVSPAIQDSVEQNVSTSVGLTDLSALSQLTPNDLLKAVKVISNEQLVQRVNAVYKFEVADESPGIYYLDLKHGSGDCGSGEPPCGNADTTITVSLEDMRQMFTGSLKPFRAYMSGQLTVSGDVSNAMKLDQLIDSIAALIPKS